MHAREIRQPQGRIGLMITKLPVQRLVKDILDRVSARALCRMQHGALEALQESAEACMVCTLPSTQWSEGFHWTVQSGHASVGNDSMYNVTCMMSWLL